MRSVGVFEAKIRFSALLEEVKKGGQIIITKHGRPVAQLVPITRAVNPEHIKDVIKKLKNFSTKNKLGLKVLGRNESRDY